MSYHNITFINLCIAISAVIMYLVGFILMHFGRKNHKKKGKLLRDSSLYICLIVAVISVILNAYEADVF